MFRLLLVVCCGLSWGQLCRLAAAEPAVEVELYTEPGFRADQSRVWFALFDELKVGTIRIREGKQGDAAKIETVGEPPRVYRVSGILTRANVLKFPGGSFGLGDKAKIGQWLAKLKEGGEEGLFEKPGPLGLTERQLLAAKKMLRRPIAGNTQGERPAVLVEKVIADAGLQVSIGADARAKLQETDKFLDELNGLSTGTALAALLRPAGLILVAEKSTVDSVKFSVIDSQEKKQPWPIGWPAGRPPKDFVPDIMKFIPVEIEDTPLSDVLTAIQGRLKIPFVIDHNSLVRERVDLAKTKITLPNSSTYYQRVLERSLFQARLKMELRLDEAEQPFLWISTIKS